MSTSLGLVGGYIPCIPLCPRLLDNNLLYQTASPLAVSSAEIISQQIYSTEVSKILINDLMKLLKQDELDGFTSSLLGLPDGRNFTGLAGSLLLI